MTTHLKAEYGLGIVVAILLPAAVLLFGLLSPLRALAAIFLLAGLWTIVFGASLAGVGNRLYYVGWGIGVAILSTIAVVPFRFTLGSVLLAIVVIIAVSVYYRNRPPKSAPQLGRTAQPPSSP